MLFYAELSTFGPLCTLVMPVSLMKQVHLILSSISEVLLATISFLLCQVL